MITSEDESLNTRNVKFKFYFFPKMRYKFLMFITTVNFLFLLRLLVRYNYSADHSDLEALTGPKHYLKSFHYPWQEPRICGEKGFFFFFGFSRFYIDRVLRTADPVPLSNFIAEGLDLLVDLLKMAAEMAESLKTYL